MKPGAIQTTTTWAEDRALLGSTPSADPGVGVEGRAGHHPPGSVILPNNTFNFNTNAKNPTRNRSTTTNRSSSQLANANGPKFQFTVNQDKLLFQGVSAADCEVSCHRTAEDTNDQSVIRLLVEWCLSEEAKLVDGAVNTVLFH